MKKIYKPNLFLALLLVAVALVLAFDLVEIIVGNFMQLTNRVRPEIGRFWIEENKQSEGSTSIEALERETGVDSTLVFSVESFPELKSMLSRRPTISMGREDFLTLYRKFTPERARQLIDPMILYDMSRNAAWKKVRLSLEGNRLHIYFYDGFGQLLWNKDTDFSTDNFKPNKVTSRLSQSSLFEDRVIDAALFLKAFDNLSTQNRLQIVGDLYKLIEWEKNLAFVGISPYVHNGTVEIAFERYQNYQTQIDTLQASEIAAAYLIQQINQLNPEISLRSPVEKENNHE
jgi:hypothetical protein